MVKSRVYADFVEAHFLVRFELVVHALHRIRDVRGGSKVDVALDRHLGDWSVHRPWEERDDDVAILDELFELASLRCIAGIEGNCSAVCQAFDQLLGTGNRSGCDAV